ncbi:Triple functional domain protein [Frankliniella fusca]|uniref:Triple functional domain protein n=1 Tax=Frankliniella fusca TaxID=407009 RepID=A0AAE1H445_9NEOP|nr:Triple functional domain protein [Frankliniella fusca]
MHSDFRAALRALLLGPGLGPDAALDFGNTGVTAVSAASRTPITIQRNNVALCTPSASPVPGGPGGHGLMVPLSTISRACAGSLWSLQPRYTPAPPLTPSRSASDLGSRSATPSGSESGTETAAPTAAVAEKDKDGHLAAPSLQGPHPPRGRGGTWRSPHPRPRGSPGGGPAPTPAPSSPLSPRSPKPRLSPLRAVGEFFTGCSWKDDSNGKAGKASSASTEPLDMDTARS